NDDPHRRQPRLFVTRQADPAEAEEVTVRRRTTRRPGAARPGARARGGQRAWRGPSAPSVARTRRAPATGTGPKREARSYLSRPGRDRFSRPARVALDTPRSPAIPLR